MTVAKTPYNRMLKEFEAHLQQYTIGSCSEYAERHRVMGKPYPGPWTFDHHPWLREMHDCDAELEIGQKAAQMGYTECALNKAFYAIDILKENVLYVLPTTNPDASDFSTSRFDPALEMSPHLAELFTDVKNIGHKRAGSCNLFVRGARSRSQLKSIPAGRLIFDEVDEMIMQNIVLAFERMSGQKNRQAFLLSTPTRENHGINSYFVLSTQEHFNFRCPHCSQYIELTFPDCIVVTGDSINDPKLKDSHIICPRNSCKGIINHEEKPFIMKDGIWVPHKENTDSRGFYINQLYSPTEKPSSIANLMLKAETNPTDEQELWNSKMGLPHIVEGGQVTEADIKACISGYKKQIVGTANKIITMGVDVGKMLDVSIVEWELDYSITAFDVNLMADARLLTELTVPSFEELSNFMFQFAVRFCVIDHEPETRSAMTFAKAHYGRVALCQYVTGIGGRSVRYDEDEHTVKVNRTVWMDTALGRFIGPRKRIALPVNTSMRYKEHLMSPARIYDTDATGNPVGKWVSGDNDPDHMAHAQTYAEIALPFAVCLVQNVDLKELNNA